jgi:Zn-dependent protease with chaperone function
VDFFGQQHRARTSTRRLVFLFIVALVLTNLAVYGAVAAALRLTYLFTRASSSSGWLTELARRFCSEGWGNWELLGWVTLGVTTIVGLVTAAKLRQLSHGGAVVAEWLGGRRVDPNPNNPEERRLLNVVEEMAIASGVPIPEVFLLDEECGINALAAGNEPTDAVVAVTFGALKLLDRDEMQGVIAHEFSHIMNGDMRLNTRLIGWLQGVLGLVVLGRILTFAFLRPVAKTQDGKGVGPVFHPVFLPAFVLGWICLAAGSLGAFAARLIKSAVSRQREYLADAAAVQFTRNPAGLAGALKKIGGLRGRSLLEAARVEEASHMYFSDGMKARWFGFLATHPPLTARIQRLDPYFDGKYPRVSLERVLQESSVTELYRRQGGKPVKYEKLASVVGPAAAGREMLFAHAARLTGASAPTTVPLRAPAFDTKPAIHLEFAIPFLDAIPALLRTAARQPFSAVALVYGLICSKEPELRARQLEGLSERAESGIVQELERVLPAIDRLDAGHFLPLADLAVPALRQLSAEQYETFRGNLDWLIETDQQIDMFEYMLQRMVVRHLEPHFRPVRKTPVQYYALKPLLPACAVLLSGLARIGHETEEQARNAFAQGAALLEAESDLQFLPLSECNLLQIDAAINQVAQASSLLKQQILTSLLGAAATDGQLQRREAELLRAIADALGAPIPPFLCMVTQPAC